MQSWKLKSDFNTQKHLFFGKIKTDYVIESFICNCSHIESVIKHSEQTIDYVCPDCGNEIFYDANRALKNPENFLAENNHIKFTISYVSAYDNDQVSSLYALKVPNNINFSVNKIKYTYKVLHSLTLCKNGELEKDIIKYEEKNYNHCYEYSDDEIHSLKVQKQLSKQTKIEKDLTNILTKQLNSFCFNIPKQKKCDMNIAQAQFFLRHKNLKDFDFYYWKQLSDLPNEEFNINSALAFISNHKTEKSIKKALFENYIAQLKNSSRFNSYLIYSITDKIKDVNLIVTFLKHNFVHTHELSTMSWMYNVFIEFLKGYYTEKQIVKLFLNYNSDADELLFRDTINELHINIDIIKQFFNKVPCKINTLHDEFVRCVRKNRGITYNKQLSYSEEYLKPCVDNNSYSVKLPKSGKDLYEWADTLHNCMSSYFNWIHNGETIIYGFFINNLLSFAVEIRNNNIVQYSAKYNKKLNDYEQKILKDWYELHFKNMEKK